MPHSIAWDAGFNQAPPATTELGQGYDAIQKTRAGVQQRLAEEHSFRLADTSNTNQGKHRQGSARALVSTGSPADPSLLPADDGEYRQGRFLFNPVTKLLRIWGNANKWETVCPFPIGATYMRWPGKAAPATLWPDTGWTNISDQFPGDFPRIAGGLAVPFGDPSQPSQNKAHNHGGFTGDMNRNLTHNHTFPLGPDDNVGDAGVRNRSVDRNAPTSPVNLSHEHSIASEGGTEAHPQYRTVELWERTS